MKRWWWVLIVVASVVTAVWWRQSREAYLRGDGARPHPAARTETTGRRRCCAPAPRAR